MTATILSKRHPGTRCKPKPPPWHRRALASLRAFRQRRAVEDARDDAYVARIEVHHDVRPFLRGLARVQAQLAALDAAQVYVACHPEQGPAVTPADAFNQPPAAVLPDEDVPGLEHLQRTWDDDTGTFTAQARGWTE